MAVVTRQDTMAGLEDLALVRCKASHFCGQLATAKAPVSGPTATVQAGKNGTRRFTPPGGRVPINWEVAVAGASCGGGKIGSDCR